MADERSDENRADETDAATEPGATTSTPESGATESATPESAPAPRRRKRLSAAGAMIGLLVGLLAFALVVQVQSNTGNTQLENSRQEDLVRILSDLNSRELRLRSEISSLQATLSQLGAGAQGREAALAEARRRADELGILAGTLSAQGEGLTIRLVPGKQPIQSATVLETVEELRGAGAEALQIAGAQGAAVRIVASTYFVDAPSGIVVDGTTLTGTYTLTVIGPGNTMRTALTIPGGVSDSVGRAGGTVVVDGPGTVKVEALHPAANLRNAKPAE
jgi:uncharacterized protein YlxW (UPF0749 family)